MWLQMFGPHGVIYQLPMWLQMFGPHGVIYQLPMWLQMFGPHGVIYQLHVASIVPIKAVNITFQRSVFST